MPPDTPRPSPEAQEEPSRVGDLPVRPRRLRRTPPDGRGHVVTAALPFHRRAAATRAGQRSHTDHDRPPRGSLGPPQPLFVNPAGVLRRDATSPEGAAPGADPAHTARQLLDAYGIDRAVLIGGEVLGLGAMPDPDLAAPSRPPTTTGWRRPGCRPTSGTAAPSSSVRVTPSRRRPKSAGAPQIRASSRCCFR